LSQKYLNRQQGLSRIKKASVFASANKFLLQLLPAGAGWQRNSAKSSFELESSGQRAAISNPMNFKRGLATDGDVNKTRGPKHDCRAQLFAASSQYVPEPRRYLGNICDTLRYLAARAANLVWLVARSYLFPSANIVKKYRQMKPQLSTKADGDRTLK
jgi:hypothetical protein